MPNFFALAFTLAFFAVLLCWLPLLELLSSLPRRIAAAKRLLNRIALPD